MRNLFVVAGMERCPSSRRSLPSYLTAATARAAVRRRATGGKAALPAIEQAAFRPRGRRGWSPGPRAGGFMDERMDRSLDPLRPYP